MAVGAPQAGCRGHCILRPLLRLLGNLSRPRGSRGCGSGGFGGASAPRRDGWRRAGGQGRGPRRVGATFPGAERGRRQRGAGGGGDSGRGAARGARGGPRPEQRSGRICPRLPLRGRGLRAGRVARSPGSGAARGAPGARGGAAAAALGRRGGRRCNRIRAGGGEGPPGGPGVGAGGAEPGSGPAGLGACQTPHCSQLMSLAVVRGRLSRGQCGTERPSRRAAAAAGQPSEVGRGPGGPPRAAECGGSAGVGSRLPQATSRGPGFGGLGDGKERGPCRTHAGPGLHRRGALVCWRGPQHQGGASWTRDPRLEASSHLLFRSVDLPRVLALPIPVPTCRSPAVPIPQSTGQEGVEVTGGLPGPLVPCCSPAPQLESWGVGGFGHSPQPGPGACLVRGGRWPPPRSPVPGPPS